MVKHTHTIHRQTAGELFECVWPFCWVGAERVKIKEKFKKYSLKNILRSLRLFPVSIIWSSSGLVSGYCLCDIVINMSKLSSLRARLYHDLTHFLRTHVQQQLLREELSLFGKASGTRQSLRRSRRLQDFSLYLLLLQFQSRFS